MDTESFFPFHHIQLVDVLIDCQKLGADFQPPHCQCSRFTVPERPTEHNCRYITAAHPALAYAFLRVRKEGPHTRRADVLVGFTKKDLSLSEAAFQSYWARFTRAHAGDAEFQRHRLERRFFMSIKVGHAFVRETMHVFAQLLPALADVAEDVVKDAIADVLVNVYCLGVFATARPIRECAACGACSEHRMRRCLCGLEGGGGPYYCSTQCQRVHWFGEGGHRNACIARGRFF